LEEGKRGHFFLLLFSHLHSLRLNYLEPPAFGKVFTLGLPEKQTDKNHPQLGFLEKFKDYLVRQCNSVLYDRTKDDTVISMCNQLEEYMSDGIFLFFFLKIDLIFRQGWVGATWYRLTAPYIKGAKKRAMKRRYTMRTDESM